MNTITRAKYESIDHYLRREGISLQWGQIDGYLLTLAQDDATLPGRPAHVIAAAIAADITGSNQDYIQRRLWSGIV